jgi:hypothetical protein
MNSLWIVAFALGVLTGIFTVVNLKTAVRILVIVDVAFFLFEWGQVEVDPIKSAALILIMLVGAAIVIAPAQLLRRTPRRSHKVGAVMR